MEKIPLYWKLTAAGAALLGLWALSRCDDEPADYEGIGHEFVVRGHVTDSETDGLVQVDGKSLVVIRATGKAATWFPEKEGHRAWSDEFDFLQKYSKEPGSLMSCGKDVYVGEVYDSRGNEIEPEELKPGVAVEIAGRIRESQYWQSTGKSGYCNEEDLAVYESVRVINEPLPTPR